MTAEELIAFEIDIAAEFNSARIRAPVHLSGGNEHQLIEIFQRVRPEDWIFCSWRSHYHCLLKGVPPAQLKADIMAGKSMTLCYPEHRVFSSAIVGGILPIAVGVALQIKRQGDIGAVWCFIGDMTSYTGIFAETAHYAMRHDLDMVFIVEHNGISVLTPVASIWPKPARSPSAMIHEYNYHLPWPHAGAGTRVNF